ncbi:hypothetical protein BGW38_010067, partial [Lunasporangiospora selenospora]
MPCEYILCAVIGQYLDPTKKRGPPKGAGRYINAIEDRLHRMEAIVGGLVREDELPNDFMRPTTQNPRDDESPPDQAMDSTKTLHSDLMRESTYQSLSSPSPVLSSEHSVGDHSESPSAPGMNTPPNNDVDDLDEELGYLSLDYKGRERYVGKSSPMFYNRGSPWRGNLYAGYEEAHRKISENPDLPDPDVMSNLINLYFRFVYPFAPVIVRSKFIQRLQARDRSPQFLLLLNAIFALASRFSDDPSLRTDPSKPETAGVKFADRAKEILDALYDLPDITCVGALVLMAFQQFGTGNAYRAWIFVGLAVRMAQHIGLHRNCLKLGKMSASDREERNRVWWSCFMADRIISVSFGRPQGITEHDVDAIYPEGFEEDQTDFMLDGATIVISGPSPRADKNFVYLASLMRILGRVMVSLYSPLSKASSLSTSSMTNPAPLEQLDKELTDWLLTLPPHLQFRSVQQEPGTFVCTLHMTFYAVLILLHRPYSHQSSHKSTNDPAISLSICTSAANNIIEMGSNLMRSVDEKRGVPRLKGLLHHVVFIFFTASLVHITNCTSTDPLLAASAKLRTIETLKCLSVMDDVWITAFWCGTNIRQLLEARSINLGCSIEAFKNMPLSSVDDLKQKTCAAAVSHADLAAATTVPNQQTFAFDVDQIMGYYQRSGTLKHPEPMGRNSRHFSPTPYYSPVAHHHGHAPVQYKTHPGLTLGHAPLPRRPRHGKNTSPSPSGSISSAPTSSSTPSSSTTSPGGYFSSAPDPMSINLGPSPNTTTLMDPFAAPGTATVAGKGLLQSPVEPTAAPLNAYQNPFSSSLWGLPTSMDTDDWLLYMQNGGGAAAGSVDLGANGPVSSAQSTCGMGAISSGVQAPAPMFNGLPELTTPTSIEKSNVAQLNVSSAGSTTSYSRAHPLSQSVTRGDLMRDPVVSQVVSGMNTVAITSSCLDPQVSFSAPAIISSVAGSAVSGPPILPPQPAPISNQPPPPLMMTSQPLSVS